MKRFVRIFCLVLVVMLVATLASCAKPYNNEGKVVQNLKNKGYQVNFISSGADETILFAYKGDHIITIFYFESSDDAKEYWKEHKEDLKEERDEAKKEGVKVVLKKSGARIWVGSKQAAKDSR